MKKILLAATAMTLVATSAMAADMRYPVRRPAPAPAYVPPPVPYSSWTGCFVGGHVGGLWSEKDWTVNAADPFFLPGRSFGSHDANSWLGGVQVGCDYQFAGGFVIGIQGDYAWTDAEGTSHDALNTPFFGSAISNRSRIDSLASLTGRLGYAFGTSFLGYVRGGGAWESDDYEIFVTGTGRSLAGASETRSGWTVGVGGEYKFTPWVSGFVEYNYYDFGTRANSLFTPGGFLFDVVDVKETKSVAKVGLNFRFGAGGGPLYARY